MLGFCVHRIGDCVKSPDTQMLQPMHSRIVSIRPVLIFSGRNGSAIEGRAAPMRSSTPLVTWRTITSGDVNLPTPTTGLLVSRLRPVTYCSCSPSGPNLEVLESASHVLSTKSQRSGSSPSSPRTSSMSGRAEACLAAALFHGDAAGHGGTAVGDLAGVLEDLPQQPHPVAGAAAIGVGALIEARREEMLDAAEGVPGVDVDEVVASPHGPDHCVAVPAAQIGDVLQAHHPGLNRVVSIAGDRQVVRAQRGLSAGEVRRVHSVVA